MKKGEKMSDEAKAHLRKLRLGTKLSPEVKAKVIKNLKPGWNKGLKGASGSDHPMWKGGKQRYFNKQVIERDKGTCQKCGLVEPDIMEVDHIKNKVMYPDLRYVMENLVTLCPNCHRRKTYKEKKYLKLSIRGRKDMQHLFTPVLLVKIIV